MIAEEEELGCEAALAQKLMESGRTRSIGMARAMAASACRKDPEAHKKYKSR
tara:strand:+ start:7820 stop:7975 length:156 start_codon:yes stop_codon:yes gene_type:complete